MGTERDIALRLRAHLAGKPIRRLEHRPVHVAATKDRMLVALVRMGGESSPWAIGWKRGGAAIQVRTVPEARRRTDVAVMVAEFGDELCKHFDSAADSLRQLWIPGGTHAEMLHFLALRYTRAKKADAAVLDRLNRTGRRCMQLFDATQNPNSAICLDATARLKEMYAFPCEPIRENHLGFLLAWLGTGSAKARALSARSAEALAVSTSLDPDIDRGIVASVEAWNDATSEATRKPHADRIRRVLQPEILRRLKLLETAIAFYENAARENPGTQRITSSSMQELTRFKDSEAFVESTGIVRSPETDHSPTTAAMSYAHKDADMIAARAALVPFDRAAQDELIAEGSAFCGDVLLITTVVVNIRKTRCEMVVSTDGSLPLRLRLQDSVVIAGDVDGRGVWRITNIADDANGKLRRITIQSAQATPTGPVPKCGAVDVVFHEKLDPELRRRLASMVKQTKDMAENGDTLGAWILKKLAHRELPDAAADTEHFDGSTTRVVDND